MRKLNKILALLLTLTLVLSIPAVAMAATREELEATMTGNAEARIDTVEIAGRDCYVYVPASPRVGNLLQEQNCFIVFPEAKLASANEALGFCITSGLAAVADREGACAVILNPLTTWDEEPDPDALIVGGYEKFNVWPNLKFVDGVANDVIHAESPRGAINNGTYPVFPFKDRFPLYPGGFQHTIFFGFGAGADFILAQGMGVQEFQINYAYQTILDTQYGNGKPAAVYLIDPTTIPAGGDAEIPVTIVNGPEAVIPDTWTALTDEDFTAQDFMDIYDGYVNTVSSRFWYKGIAQLNGTYTWIDTQEVAHDQEYYLYIPEYLDLTEEGSVPMLVWCHGNDGEAEFMCNFSGWIDYAVEIGIVVMSLDQHNSTPADEIMNMIDEFIEDNPYIDSTRLYYGGFSMGSMKTWSVAVPNWNRFAAIIPNAGNANALGGNTAGIPGALLPVFYIGGGNGLSEVGTNFAGSGNIVWSLNMINGGSFPKQDVAAYGAFGVESDSFEEYYEEADGDSWLQVYGYESDVVDGNGDPITMTWLACSPNRAHSLTPTDPAIVWEHIMDFSRGEDGTLYYQGEPIVRDWPEITQSPASVANVNLGDFVEFHAAAEGENLSYQWEVSNDGGLTWGPSASSGNKTDTLSVKVIKGRSDNLYRCAISSNGGTPNHTGTASISLTKPVVTSAPADQMCDIGQSVEFKVVATGEGLKYQWQVSSDNGTTWVDTSSKGSKTDTLTVKLTSSKVGYVYHCIVTNSNGESVTSPNTTVMSFFGMVFVMNPPAKLYATLSVTGNAPTVTTVNVSGNPKDAAVFSVTAQGYGLTYQWQVSQDGRTWVDATSANNKTNTMRVVINAARMGYYYRCVVTDKFGQSVNSANFRIPAAS